MQAGDFEAELGVLHSAFIAAMPAPHGPLPNLGLPPSIPMGEFGSKHLKLRYGLESTAPELVAERPLCDQLECMQSWAQTSLQPNRPAGFGAVATRSWEKHRKHALLFLGFAHNIRHEKSVDLRTYLRLDVFAAYLGLLMQKERGRGTLKGYIVTAMKVGGGLLAVRVLEAGRVMCTCGRLAGSCCLAQPWPHSR